MKAMIFMREWRRGSNPHQVGRNQVQEEVDFLRKSLAFLDSLEEGGSKVILANNLGRWSYHSLRPRITFSTPLPWDQRYWLISVLRNVGTLTCSWAV